jgi:hypothetical protein
VIFIMTNLLDFSFLRSQDAVEHELEKSKLTFMGKAIMAFGMLKPEGTKGTAPKSMTIDSTIEYGRYLANDIANCVGCHTERDLKTGAFVGEDFAGGMLFPPDAFSQGKSFMTPNLTPDPATGHMTNWSEETFINRFKSGKVIEGSPMPWGAFSRINELELKAIYRYIQSLDPIENKIEKIVFEKGEETP